jgi:hypothetical protein
MDGLDVVAVRIEHEGRVVPGMIAPLAGSAVILPASDKRRGVEALHGLPVGRLEGKMNARRQLAPIDPELVRREVGVGLVPGGEADASSTAR